MAFKAKNKVSHPNPKPQPFSPSLKDNLDKQELTIILNMIKETKFKGEDIELLYKLVIKLQNQYLKIKD